LDRIDADAVRRELDRGRARHRIDARFGRIVMHIVEDRRAHGADRRRKARACATPLIKAWGHKADVEMQSAAPSPA